MTRLPEILKKYEAEILSDWMKEQLAAIRRRDLMNDADLREQSTTLLREIARAAESGVDTNGPSWEPARRLLSEISASRARQGFSPIETATFVFSLKQPVMSRLRKELGNDAVALFEEVWNSNILVDRLGLYTMEAYIKIREQVIARQQEEMLELSTPVVKLWEGILALPLIGTLDSARTQVVMESLLNAIVSTNSRVAIIDITGVPTVDTLVAQHLLKTITAARLMGAECIISGVRPQIAQTIVHLGINLSDIITKSKLSDAFALALDRSGRTVVKAGKQEQGASENGRAAEEKSTRGAKV